MKSEEMIKKAIKQLLDEEEHQQEEEDTTSRRRQLLSELMSQLESLEEDKIVSKEEEIMKELKNLKRQNTITHCLVTAMIVLTIAWQLSEVSLILKIKDGFTNPFKSLGGMIKGLLKNRTDVNNVQGAIKHASQMQKQVIEPSTYLPGLKIPHLELPGFDDSNSDDDDDDEEEEE